MELSDLFTSAQTRLRPPGWRIILLGRNLTRETPSLQAIWYNQSKAITETTSGKIRLDETNSQISRLSGLNPCGTQKRFFMSIFAKHPDTAITLTPNSSTIHSDEQLRYRYYSYNQPHYDSICTGDRFVVFFLRHACLIIRCWIVIYGSALKKGCTPISILCWYMHTYIYIYIIYLFTYIHTYIHTIIITYIHNYTKCFHHNNYSVVLLPK